MSEGERRPTNKHLQAVKIWPQPKNAKQLKGWLGFVGFYSSYMSELARQSVCLFNLLKKGAAWEWGEEEARAFEGINKQLLDGRVLKLVEGNRHFRLETDASEFAVGGVLLQEEGGVWKPFCFYSRKLSAAQKRWNIREKECYAIIRGLTKWQC